MREARFGRGRSVGRIAFAHEAEALEGVRVRVDGRVVHDGLLRNGDPIACWHVGAVRKGEGGLDFVRHAD